MSLSRKIYYQTHFLFLTFKHVILGNQYKYFWANHGNGKTSKIINHYYRVSAHDTKIGNSALWKRHNGKLHTIRESAWPAALFRVMYPEKKKYILYTSWVNISNIRHRVPSGHVGFGKSQTIIFPNYSSISFQNHFYIVL